MKTILPLLAVLVSYPAYAEITIDGSSKSSFEQSVEEMIESYASSEMKEAFSKALLKKLMDTHPLTANLSGFERLALVPQAAETMHETLNGVTQGEIERTILFSVNSEASSDDNTQPEINQKSCDLDQHITLKTQSIELKDLMGTTAVVKLSVENTGPFAISGFAVSYSLRTVGRTVPWETDDYYFNEVSGGIEPQEAITDTMYISDLNDDRVSQPLSLDLKLVDVRDYEGRFLNDPNVNLIDYPDELTHLDCIESK